MNRAPTLGMGRWEVKGEGGVVDFAGCGGTDRGGHGDGVGVAAGACGDADGAVPAEAGGDLGGDYECGRDAVVRDALKSVQKLAERNGLPADVEVTTSGTIPMETVEMDAPRKLVSRIAGEKLPFGGTWTFEIAPTEEGATLRITERGWVSNPFFRFMAKFVLGQTSTMESYLRSLAKKFGEPARIEE
jgi:hypothetical protein